MAKLEIRTTPKKRQSSAKRAAVKGIFWNAILLHCRKAYTSCSRHELKVKHYSAFSSGKNLFANRDLKRFCAKCTEYACNSGKKLPYDSFVLVNNLILLRSWCCQEVFSEQFHSLGKNKGETLEFFDDGKNVALTEFQAAEPSPSPDVLWRSLKWSLSELWTMTDEIE
ncbi:hypothetical protein NPIL_605811 [Nephila pilipes]|uniref:Uncharacterized protein n=1 Tax=Nephila pilipes TaxID=299642 RepID=A0A8X6T9Q1_NEPPI|nr:hypothetical protein NPIL_605811 [Nephila pilipes]